MGFYLFVSFFKTWLDKTCEDNGWNHKTSPIIWRELIDRGGKGVLVGGASDFQEYVKGYYGLESHLTSYDMRLIAEENYKTKLVSQISCFLKQHIFRSLIGSS